MSTSTVVRAGPFDSLLKLVRYWFGVGIVVVLVRGYPYVTLAPMTRI